MQLFRKSRCCICAQKDFKSNMDYVFYGIYNDCKRFFHPTCVKTVICDPENYDNEVVDNALWVKDLVDQRAKGIAHNLEVRKDRLKKAQSAICD